MTLKKMHKILVSAILARTRCAQHGNAVRATCTAVQGTRNAVGINVHLLRHSLGTQTRRILILSLTTTAPLGVGIRLPESSPLHVALLLPDQNEPLQFTSWLELRHMTIQQPRAR